MSRPTKRFCEKDGNIVALVNVLKVIFLIRKKKWN